MSMSQTTTTALLLILCMATNELLSGTVTKCDSIKKRRSSGSGDAQGTHTESEGSSTDDERRVEKEVALLQRKEAPEWFVLGHKLHGEALQKQRSKIRHVESTVGNMQFEMGGLKDQVKKIDKQVFDGQVVLGELHKQYGGLAATVDALKGEVDELRKQGSTAASSAASTVSSAPGNVPGWPSGSRPSSGSNVPNATRVATLRFTGWTTWEPSSAILDDLNKLVNAKFTWAKRKLDADGPFCIGSPTKEAFLEIGCRF